MRSTLALALISGRRLLASGSECPSYGVAGGEAVEADHELEGGNVMLLQQSLSFEDRGQKRQNMPSVFFDDEDAAPTAAMIQRGGRASAPNDVGTGAVPSYPGSVLPAPLVAPAAPAAPRSHVALSQARAEVAEVVPQARGASHRQRHSFFDDEDAAQRRPPEHQVGVPSKEQAQLEAEAELRTQEAAEKMQRQRAEKSQRRPVSFAVDEQARMEAEAEHIAQQEAEHRRFNEPGASQRQLEKQARETLELSAEEAAREARRFFEFQGDLGGQEPMPRTRRDKSPDVLAKTSPESATGNAATRKDSDARLKDSGPKASHPSAASVEELSRSQLSASARLSAKDSSLNQVSLSQVSSRFQAASAQAAALGELKGHSQAGGRLRAAGAPPLDAQTGEEGELYGTHVDPNLLRLAFEQKSEGVLGAERRIYQAQDHTARVQQNTSEEYSNLKAEVYHAADLLRFQELEKQKEEVARRRTELLTDANMYKAQVAYDARLQAQQTATYERELHLTGEVAQSDREHREQADLRIQAEEEAARAVALRAEEEAGAEALSALRSSNRLRESEHRTLENMTRSALDTREAARDVAERYREFGLALDERQVAENQRIHDFEHYFGTAASVAQGRPAAPAVSSSAPTSASAIQAPAVAEVPGRTVVPITIPVQGTHVFIPDNRPGSRMPSRASMLATAASANSKPEAHSPVSFAEAITKSALETCQPGSTSWPACASTQVSFGPEHSSCTPQCTWQCDSPRCEQVCEPMCQPPQCETRCSGIDTSQCHMECEEPHCVVACPANLCPSGDCPSCTTTCSEPSCKLQCPNDQPCRSVCEQPSCQWQCRAPEECPAPQCQMVCETPQGCTGSTYQQMPPLAPGETSVQSFAAPLGLMQSTGSRASAPSSVQVQLMTRSQHGDHEGRAVMMPIISHNTGS